ncbi:MAG: DMT family transporter [Hyphomicrobiaceae bacterium]
MTDPLTLAAVIALSVSLLFGLSNHVQHIALDHMDVRTGTLVNVATTAIVLWLLSPAYLTTEALLSPAVVWFALAGLIVPSLSMTLQTLSIRTIGPGLTSGLASTAPLFAIGIAVAAFGEVVTGRVVLGTAIIVGGIAWVALRSRSGGASWPVWAVAIPLAAALTRGLSQNLLKLGLGLLASPLTAALVASTTSFAILSLIHAFRGGQRLPGWNRGYAWFVLCGLMNGAGIVGSNIALELSSVVVVAPLIATSPAFTLLTGWLFFRRERVRWSFVVAIVVIFAGCLLIVTR